MSLFGKLARGAVGFATGGLTGAALSLGGAAIRRSMGGGGPSPEERYYNDRFKGAVSGLGERVNSLEGDYINDMEGFDPEQAFSEKTTADLDSFDDDFARKYASQVADQVGGGRSPATNGFGLRDVQQTIRTGMQDRARIRMQNADALAAMRLQKYGMEGSYAQNARDTYMDAIGGRLNTLEGDRYQDAASKRGLYGSLLGAAATGVGAYYGGRR